eukprot:CAMPEP_0185726898 /NCGR_PEP_ID=MMETSP1171-20130828/2735_1 /TAXON_ID=374046 /ORGANISM="Helicotheca tamensis, Strain CCMP826" /LENGTH=232 /DNA_ID=CAMNT_0028395339 /DNA_START=104 /DNA_END=802 /DNA_ORIENTATION=+
MSNHDAPEKVKTVPSIKVYYWKFPFWRAEVLRAGLFLQGIPFEDITSKEELDAIKERAPFGAFPIMEVDGKIMSQTQAMASYVGKLGGMYPSSDDLFAQANCDEIINGCTDVTDTIGSTFRTPKDEVEEARKKLIDPDNGRLYKHMKGLNSVVCRDGSVFACGKEHGLTVADLAVWSLVGWLSGGKLDHIPVDLDHIPVDLVMSFDNLKNIYDNVEREEKMIEYQKQFYPKE